MRKMGWLMAAAAQVLFVASASARDIAMVTTAPVEVVQIEKFGVQGQWAPHLKVDLSGSAAHQAGLWFFAAENLGLGLELSGQFLRSGTSKEQTAHVAVTPKLGYNVEISPWASFFPQVGVSYGFAGHKLEKTTPEKEPGTHQPEPPQQKVALADPTTPPASQPEDTASPETKAWNHSLQALLFLPVVGHADHFFLAIGPQVSMDILDHSRVSAPGLEKSVNDVPSNANLKDRHVNVGLRAEVGAWF